MLDWIDQLLANEVGIFCIEEEDQYHYIHQTRDIRLEMAGSLVLQPNVEALTQSRQWRRLRWHSA